MEDKEFIEQLLGIVDGDREYLRACIEKNTLQVEALRKQRHKDKIEKRIMFLIIFLLIITMGIISFANFNFEIGVKTSEIKIEAPKESKVSISKDKIEIK